jgi:hypothetical protein
MFTESRARTTNIISDCVNWADGCEGINTGTTQTDGNVPAPTPDLLSSWTWNPSRVNQDSELPSTTDGLGLSTQVVESGPQPSLTSIQSQTQTIRTAITTSRTQSTAPSQSTSIITQDPSSATPTFGIVAAISDGNESKGLSAGAVTGVAIGTFIIGAALAFVAAFFLFKQRNKHKNGNVSTKDYPSFADSAPDLGMMQKGVGGLGGRHSPYVQVSQTPMPASPAPALSPPMIAPIAMANEASKDVTSFLPPAADDDEVWTGVSHLFSMMHEHVEKFYRDVHACITPSMEHGIAKFGVKGVDMAELLQECSSPTAALKHALVAYVLGITGPKQEGDREETLFPEELAHVANGTGGGSGKYPPSPQTQKNSRLTHHSRPRLHCRHLPPPSRIRLPLQHRNWVPEPTQILDGTLEYARSS